MESGRRGYVRHAAALGLKLTAYAVIFGVTMPILGWLALPQSLILAAVHTLLLWFADLVILPRFGSGAALVSDAVQLVMGSFLVLGSMAAFPNPVGLALAVLLGVVFEWWFHRWLLATAVVE
jgi:hypothetical protein